MLTLEEKPNSEMSVVDDFIKDQLRIDLPNGQKELVFYFDAQALVDKGFTHESVESEFCTPLKESFIEENDDFDINHLVEMDEDERYLRVIFKVSHNR